MLGFPFFRLARSKETLAVVFDIRDSSVGAALVLLRKDKLPKIIYVTRHAFVRAQKGTLRETSKNMLKALGRAASDIERSGFSYLAFTPLSDLTPKSVFCVLGSPWYGGHARTITFSRNKPFRIDSKLISEVLDREIASLKQSEHKHYLHEGIRKGEVVLFERKILRVSLNRYPIDRPYGQWTRNISLDTYLSIAPQKILRNMHAMLHQTFHPEAVYFHSSALSLFDVARDIWSSLEDFLLIEVGGEITEVAVVRRGVVHELCSFPLGSNSIAREISKKLNVSFEEASSLARLAVSKRVRNEIREYLSRVLSKQKDTWHRELQNALLHVSNGLFLPNTVILLSLDGSFSEWLTLLIKEKREEESHRSLFHKKSLKIIRFDQKTLASLIEVGPGASNDRFLSINTLFANKIYYLP